MIDEDPGGSGEVCSAAAAGSSSGSTQPAVNASYSTASQSTSDSSTFACTPASQNLSSQDYSASDKAAARTGSDRSVDAAAGGCSGKSSQTSNQPCDLDDLVLNEMPGNKVTTYRLEKGSFVAEEPKGNKRAVSLTGASGVEKQPKLQVVSDRPGSKGLTQIRTFVYPFASCGSSHLQVSAVGPGGTDIEKVFPAQDTFDFPVTRYESDSLAASLFQRIITFGIQPSRYVVSADSCGIRADGQQAYTGGNLTVEAYPSDQYQLSLSIPALHKKTFTREKTITRENTTTTTTEGSDGGTTTTTDEMRNQTRRHHITVERGEEDKKPTVELKHNDQSVDVAETVQKIFDILQDVKKAIATLKDVLHEWVPQAGFKFEFDLSFLSGDVSIACGWKEWEDWRVYYGFSAHFALTLIEISLTLSFGISVNVILARVEGMIDGAKIELKEDYDFNNPQTQVEFDLVSKIDIPMALDGRAEAGYGWAKVEIAAGFKTGFEGEGGFRLKGKWSCFADVKWAGIDAFVTSKPKPPKPRNRPSGIWWTRWKSGKRN
jgi:hypothetical protein